MEYTSQKPIQIMLVEDNPGDIRLVREAMKDNRIANQIFELHDGQAALDYLLKKKKQAHYIRPHLIILDLNLPKKGGLEVLDIIKKTPSLKRIPVIVFSISGDEEDVKRAYDSYANCFISKSLDLDEFSKIVTSIENFWMHTAVLPNSLN
jgi:two-component system response regulator